MESWTADSQKFTYLDIDRRSGAITDKEYYAQRSGLLRGRDAHVFDTMDDIIAVVDLVTPGTGAFVFPVERVYDPRRMILAGLSPTSREITAPWITDWLEGMPLPEIEFWHDISGLGRIIQLMHDEMSWAYIPLQNHQQFAIRTAFSGMLLMYAPELLYTRSKRPRTDMSLFRSPLSRTIARDFVRDGVVTLSGEQWNVAPVTRYADGMSKGLYYGETPVAVCGTFYYREEESSTLLAYRTSLVAFNKTAACEQLGVQSDVEIADNMSPQMNGELPGDLMMSPVDASKYVDNAALQVISPALSQREHYAGKFLGLYAEEDTLDQPLCNAARAQGIDVVILTHMVGAYQIVTEVLDTRTRAESFRSLVYITE